MKIAVVGGGILGLSLGVRLSRLGHRVEVLEASPQLGGLAAAHDYGAFTWDRYYHCILPQDRDLIALLDDLGLASSLRWTQTKTGYFANDTFYSMSSNADLLRFPLLSLLDKGRMGAMVIYATRFADPWQLYQVTAEKWLTQLCGRRTYEVFWRPLLKAKFGPFFDQVAAVFIWATLKRLFGARSPATAQEKLGYVEGGYARILQKIEGALNASGGIARTSAPVVRIQKMTAGCEVSFTTAQGPRTESYDQVFFTGPTRLAKKVVSSEFAERVNQIENQYPTASTYLGVACLVLALKRPLTPYYVLNIGDERVKLTGLIEMTNLIDATRETKDLSLVYLPKYMDSEDPRLDSKDDTVAKELMDEGVRRIFPAFRLDEIVYQGVHRAKLVQPLPLVRHGIQPSPDLPSLERPFQVLNTSMLTCATLNNNEVVALVDRFVKAHGNALLPKA